MNDDNQTGNQYAAALEQAYAQDRAVAEMHEERCKDETRVDHTTMGELLKEMGVPDEVVAEMANGGETDTPPPPQIVSPWGTGTPEQVLEATKQAHCEHEFFAETVEAGRCRKCKKWHDWSDEKLPTPDVPLPKIVTMTCPFPDVKAYLMGDCIIMVGSEGDEHPRLHISVSRKDRLPSWEEMKAVRYQIAPAHYTMAMLLPPEKEYVNVHNFCFHLWEI